MLNQIRSWNTPKPWLYCFYRLDGILDFVLFYLDFKIKQKKDLFRQIRNILIMSSRCIDPTVQLS